MLLVADDPAPSGSASVDTSAGTDGRRWRDIAVIAAALLLVVGLLTWAGGGDDPGPSPADDGFEEAGGRASEGRLLPTGARSGGRAQPGDGPRFYGPLIPIQTGLRLVTLTA